MARLPTETQLMTPRKRLLCCLVAVVLCLCNTEAWAQGLRKPMLSKPISTGAHRGGAALWPESTVLAFRKTFEQWPQMLLETDARLTADGHVVLVHDERVDRTTDGTGLVSSLTLEQVKGLDAGYGFTQDEGSTYPYRGRGVAIATLEEALEALPDARWLVEFKDDCVAEVIAVIRRAGAIDRVLAASFDPALMDKARQLAPELATCYDTKSGANMRERLEDGTWDSYVRTDDVLSLTRNMVKLFSLTPERLERIRSKGVVTQVHTVNDPEEMRTYYEMGFDSILTDRPDLLAHVAGNRK